MIWHDMAGYGTVLCPMLSPPDHSHEATQTKQPEHHWFQWEGRCGHPRPGSLPAVTAVSMPQRFNIKINDKCMCSEFGIDCAGHSMS